MLKINTFQRAIYPYQGDSFPKDIGPFTTNEAHQIRSSTLMLLFRFLKIYCHRVSYRFGIVAMFSGIIGVPSGSILSQHLRLNTPNCDPLICAFGLLFSSIFIYLAVVSAGVSFFWTLTFVFIAETSLNFTWSLVADMLLVSKHLYFKNFMQLSFLGKTIHF